MDDKLRRRPLVHVVDRVVLFKHLLRFLFPGTTTPFMVELRSLSDNRRSLDERRDHSQRTARP